MPDGRATDVQGAKGPDAFVGMTEGSYESSLEAETELAKRRRYAQIISVKASGGRG